MDLVNPRHQVKRALPLRRASRHVSYKATKHLQCKETAIRQILQRLQLEKVACFSYFLKTKHKEMNVLRDTATPCI